MKFFSTVIAILVFCHPARSELRIDVSGGHYEPMRIAVPEFIGNSGTEKELGENIAKVITADLTSSGLFVEVDKSAFIESLSSISIPPKFKNWEAINAAALVQGVVEIQSENKIKVSFRLWDIFAGIQMEGKVLFSTPSGWRNIAHIVADTIYQRITGEQGYFNTRIVYISESGPLNKRVKRLAIMDQDGANQKTLTDGRDMVLTPRFSPNMQQITYLSYHNDTPRVYLLTLDTGKQEVVGDFAGMTFAPRFSYSGKSLVFSMALDGNSYIYALDLASKKLSRLTDYPAIETSPSYSPDDKKIVFNSDRSGTQQLYVMDADGSGVKRISFGEGRYATPVWSPRGDYIAFTKILRGKFYIGVMLADGDGERLLAEGYMVEGPTWSPNGRVLMFYRQKPGDRNGRGAEVKIYSVDVTGYNERQIPTAGDASDPAWSSVLQ